MKRSRNVFVAACVALALSWGPAGLAIAQDKSQDEKKAQAPSKDAKKCSNCGRVEQIRSSEKSDWKKYAAPAGGAVVGGLVGNQFGGGSGKTALTVVGALGGALAGHKVEEKHRDKVYEVVVKMDDGSHRTVTYESSPPVREGDRVKLRDGQLVLVES
jgi:outer membrane lipoprotein SlyB